MRTRTRNKRTNANDLYDVYLDQQTIHKYNDVYNITEGISDLVTYEDCFWLLDVIVENQDKISVEVQIWNFNRVEQNKFILSCNSIDGIVLLKIENVRTSFYFDDLMIMKKKNLICLPIEENMY